MGKKGNIMHMCIRIFLLSLISLAVFADEINYKSYSKGLEKFIDAKINNKVVGQIMYSSTGNPPEQYALDHLAVDFDQRKSGIATELFEMMVEDVKKRGGKKIVWTAKPSEDGPSLDDLISFYKKRGAVVLRKPSENTAVMIYTIVVYKSEKMKEDNREIRYIRAFIDNKEVGFAKYYKYNDDTYFLDKLHVFEIDKEHTYRGQGIGTELFKRTLEDVSNQSARYLAWRAFPIGENPPTLPKLIKFYKDRGAVLDEPRNLFSPVMYYKIYPDFNEAQKMLEERLFHKKS